ncbi:MAG: hypothetical protein A3J14_01905 [Candidatus Levybacteria bacterium RIFCSPLOWO2_02_FULL_37_18]|nr:MAG: hypothetical protein A3J14_01905 [Candidatus Levybacteria bacterium RIFCSPLOWO2_02_FULL_37_18]
MIKNKISILIIVLIWVIFSFPYVINRKVPFPSTYQVNNFAPWSHYEKFWGPVKNGAMPDIITQIYPWKHLTIETYKSNQIPFWNPYNFSGNPHLANFQTAVFTPLNILFFIFPFIYAWSIIVLIQPLIAGLCMYIFLRSLEVSKEGSLIGSITFMFCGFMVVWMAYATLSMAIAFFPLTLFAIEKIYKKPMIRYLLLLSLSIVLSLFSGHFQTSIYLLLFSFVFFVFKFFTTKKNKEGIFVITGFLLGIMLSMPQLIPAINLYLNSVRSVIFNQSGGIPFYYLVTIFSPDFFGNPVTRNDWFGYYAEWSSFVGIIPLTLAIFSLYRLRNKTILFFTISTVIILLLAIDSPLQKFVGNLEIPVLSTSNPSRIIVLFSFSIAVLASFGLDIFKEIVLVKSKKKYFPHIVVGFMLLIIWILTFGLYVLPEDKSFIAKRNLIFPTLLLTIFVLTTWLSKFYRNKKNRFLIISVVAFGMISFDSLRFVQKWMPYDPKELVFPQTSIVKAIKKEIGYNRIYGNLGTEVNTYYKIPSIEGYDPLYINRYGEFIESAETGKYKSAMRSVVRLERGTKYTNRVLDLLGVSIIFHPIADTNQGWAYPVWEDKERNSLIYKDNKFELFKNKKALNRVQLFYNYLVLKDNKKLLEQFYNDDFDFRKVLLLEEYPKGSISGEGTGSAKIISYTPNKIVVESESTSSALLFLSDNFYPGWKAKVNGKEAKIYRADYSFRSVIVPSGKSIVEFTYSLY